MDVPNRSLVYYALCELSDAYDALSSLSSRLSSESPVKSKVEDILFMINSAIDKVNDLPY